MCDVTKCPNPLCGASFVRTATATWYRDGEKCVDCSRCGVALEELFQAVAAYRVAREAYLKADAASDRAFRNWWHRMRSGASTNAGRATHLANLTNYASADLSGAEGKVWSHELDPREVDAADGVDALTDRVV